MKSVLLILFVLHFGFTYAQYAPAAGQVGTTAIHKDSSIIVSWGFKVVDFNPGPQNILVSNSPLADFGDSTEALGMAEGTSFDVVSLGDAGSITIEMQFPITNGPGPDFAVFENSFLDDFLELAFVEVSTNGQNFVRFPAVSLTQTASQTGPFMNTQPTDIYNLAGKYKQGYGTPFDLEDIVDSAGINLDSIQFVRIIDVIGTIDQQYASYDSNGDIINDPFPTDFESCGFDLDAIAVINENNIYASTEEVKSIFKIYPNPASQVINIVSTHMQLDSPIQIYSHSGQMIMEVQYQSSIDISDLPNGLYILKSGSFCRKLIVRH